MTKRNHSRGVVALLALALFAPLPAAAQQVLRMATLQGGSQPSYEGALRMAEIVAQESEGRLEIRVLGDGQLGTEQETLEGVQLGTVDMYMGSTGAVGRFLPKLEAFAHPYVWRDVDHMLAVARGPIGAEMTEELRRSTGIRVLDMGWVFGRRHLTTRDRAVTTPEDMAGLKIRVQPTAIYLETIRAMGGSPTPMDFKEVYTSLQTGVIDGQENPVNVIAARALNEVQGYMIRTGHITQNQAVAINDGVFEALSPDLQEIVASAARTAGDHQNALLVESEKQQTADLERAGMKIIDPDLDAFRSATADVHTKFTLEWGEGFFERLRAAGQ